MTKIIKVESVPNYFAVNWMLGALCNYDCMYCDKELHDTTSKPHSLELMQESWRNIQRQTQHLNLPYKISFTGGEVTANKNFLPFLKWIREQVGESAFIVFTTNGSASLNYYKKVTKLVNAIGFSTHSEFMDEKKFFEKVRAINEMMVRPEKSVHVSLMNEYWNQDRIELYKKFMDEHEIHYSLNTIDYTRQTRTFFVKKGVYNIDQI